MFVPETPVALVVDITQERSFKYVVPVSWVKGQETWTQLSSRRFGPRKGNVSFVDQGSVFSLWVLDNDGQTIRETSRGSPVTKCLEGTLVFPCIGGWVGKVSGTNWSCATGSGYPRPDVFCGPEDGFRTWSLSPTFLYWRRVSACIVDVEDLCIPHTPPFRLIIRFVSLCSPSSRWWPQLFTYFG